MNEGTASARWANKGTVRHVGEGNKMGGVAWDGGRSKEEGTGTCQCATCSPTCEVALASKRDCWLGADTSFSSSPCFMVCFDCSLSFHTRSSYFISMQTALSPLPCKNGQIPCSNVTCHSPCLSPGRASTCRHLHLLAYPPRHCLHHV